ncbi:MAG: hypothetical protein MH204_07855, partial [Fimbriimonadaceae bacterium]|nr:hypothetical protein [Fimbriimonadaceae bacterium]
MKSKTITIALIAGLVAVAAAFGVRFFTEAQRTAAFPYIRPEAGLAYTEFANTVTVDSPAAKAALATAERAAPGNAFHDYLAAVSSAVNEDFPAATSALEAGRRKNEIAVFTTEPMPAPMEAVPTLRKLVVRPADLKHLSDEEAVAYLTAVREAGLHMTQVDPIDALAAIHVVAVVKGATSNLVALA